MTSHRLTIEGEHRHWTISNGPKNPTLWTISVEPRMGLDNPARSIKRSANNLTDAYDAYVLAEYADNGDSI